MSQQEQGYIYALVRNGDVFYVGQTTYSNPETRLKQHKQRFGNNITMTILAVMPLNTPQDYRNLTKAESEWIDHFSKIVPLENGTYNPQWKQLP